MTPSASGTITDLLQLWRNGDAAAGEELMTLVYPELHRLAHFELRREHARDALLQTTAVVNEAYVRLVGLDVDWQGRVHFLALCGRLMRRILMDFARRKRAVKRGGGLEPTTVSGVAAREHVLVEMLALDAALTDLSALDERKSRVVELRCFAGLTTRESAEHLDISPATVERELKLARAWLCRAMSREAVP